LSGATMTVFFFMDNTFFTRFDVREFQISKFQISR
jgi:hypothetical protein